MTSRFFIPLIALAALGMSAAPVLADASADLISQGRILLAQNDPVQSIKMLESAVAANPASAEANALLATAYLRYGQPDKGLTTAQAATRLASSPADRAQASFLVGRAQLQVYMQSRVALAKKYGGKEGARDLENQMGERQYELPQGTSSTGSGLGGDAQSPDSATYSDVDQVGDASAQDEQHQDSQELLDAIANLNKSLGDTEKSFRNTLAADPAYPDAHDGLGITLAVEGNVKSALAEFQAEIQRDPTDLPALAHLAGLQDRQGDTKGAILSYRRIVKLNPRDGGSFGHLAVLYSKQRDSSDEQWAKGMALLEGGNFSLAEAAFANVKKTTPAILRGQALLALAQNKASEAQPLVDKAVALAPDDAESLVLLGDTQINGGKPQDALQTYSKATVSDPTNDAAWYGIGLAQDKLADPKDAISAYAKAVAVNPNNSSAQLNLAADQADAGLKTDAVATLRGYQQRFPQAHNAADVETFIMQLTAS